MPLDYHKWIPDTRLRLINFGKGVLEVTVSVKPDEITTGSKITISPNSAELITLLELFPPGTDLNMVNDTNVLFHLKNIGQAESGFKVQDYGPYKTTVPPGADEPFSAQDLVNYLERIISESDFFRMDEILATETPEHYKNTKHLFGIVSLLKGKMATAVFKFDMADEYFETAWGDIDKQTQRWCCFDWSTALMSKMMLPDISSVEKGRGIQKAIEILSRITAVTENTAFAEFDRMAAKCKLAFCLCYLDEQDEALKTFDDCSYTAIDEKDYKSDLLRNLFASIHYGFAVALELKNGLLLKNLSRIIACDTEVFNREQSPVRSMRIALSKAVEKQRNGPLNGFKNFSDNGYHFAPEFKNLREFINLQNGKDEKAVDNFIYFTETL